jgi:hypothetical protein
VSGRWFRGGDLVLPDQRSDFDPVAEGKRLGLDPYVSEQIWARVRREWRSPGGSIDDDQVHERFRELAKRVAARGGHLGPGIGKVTLLEASTPGPSPERDVLVDAVPGRTTEVLANEWRWERRMPGTEVTSVDTEPPHKDVVKALLEHMGAGSSRVFSLDDAERAIDASPATAASPVANQLTEPTSLLLWAWFENAPKDGAAGSRTLDAVHGRGAARTLDATRRIDADAIAGVTAANALLPGGTRPSVQTLFRGVTTEAAKAPDAGAAAEPGSSRRTKILTEAAGTGSFALDSGRAIPGSDARSRQLGFDDHRPGEPLAAPTFGSRGRDGFEIRIEDEDRLSTSTNETPHALRNAHVPLRTTPTLPLVAHRSIVTAPRQAVVMRWADGAVLEGEAVEAALKPTGGEPLPPALRARFEREFGYDLSAVRLHRDGAAHSAAQALRARAFTIGEHVFFLGGVPVLDSPDGRALLAHELTHVVQHYQGRIALRPGFAVSRPDDPLEREADAVGAAVARGAGTTPARALMGTSTATVGGDARTSGSATGLDGGGLNAPSAPSLTGFRDPAPSGAADARTGKLPGRPPSTDALIGHVPPTKSPGGKPPAAPSPKPVKHAKPATAAKPAARGAPHADMPPLPSNAKPVTSHPPAADAAPSLYSVPAATGSDGAAPTARRSDGPPTSAADRAAARHAAVAAEQQLAAHGDALAAHARTAGQQVLAMITTDADQQRQHVTAAAQTARQEIEQSIAGQRTAIVARATAEQARVAASVATQRAMVHAAAQTQRDQASAQISAKRQAAQVAAQQTKQGITQAGEVQAQRATAQTLLRVQHARAIASATGAAGDAERANAQREAATKISARAVEGVQANGRELVQASHETATALAAEVDSKLADYNHSLEKCATENEQHITKLETDAVNELATMGRQAEQSIASISTEAVSALEGYKAERLASIEQSSALSKARIRQSVAAIHANATTKIEEQCEQLSAAGRAARVVFEGVHRVDQVATVAAEARGQLDQAGTGVGHAIQALHSATQRELTSAGEAAATAMTLAGGRGAAEATTAGTTLLEKLATVATGATTSIDSRGNKAQATLVAGGQTFAQQLTEAHRQFTEKIGGLVALATHTISEKVDAGVAYQDQWVNKARGDAASTAQQIGSRYDALKAQADARNTSGAQRSWLSDAWDTVTGWIDSVRQWFLRTFGEFWGGLLFGILSALVVVVIGVAIGWAVGAIVGAFIASATVAAIVTAVILIGGAIAIAIYARFQEFYADNPGQSAGFWRGLGLVALGVADLTGIPYMVEGIVGQRAFGAKLNTAQRTERFGMGLVFLATFGLATWKGVKWFRGRAPAAPVDPHAPPAADPHGPPGSAPDPNTPTHDPNPPAHDPNAPAHDPNAPAQEPEKSNAPASRELGLSTRATDALASMENIKEDPVGDVNSDPAHNHYAAARREAAGEVVARKANGTPFDHIQDLQQAYRGLENVRAALEAEIRNPPDTMTERGLQVLLDKYSELQGIMSRLKGFLSSIGQGNFPPFHQWPPGS